MTSQYETSSCIRGIRIQSNFQVRALHHLTTENVSHYYIEATSVITVQLNVCSLEFNYRNLATQLAKCLLFVYPIKLLKEGGLETSIKR